VILIPEEPFEFAGGGSALQQSNYPIWGTTGSS
jgi:hypothetical protein